MSAQRSVMRAQSIGHRSVIRVLWCVVVTTVLLVPALVVGSGVAVAAGPSSLFIAPSNNNLTDGQTVQVSGSGLAPSTVYQGLYECTSSACDNSTMVPVTTDVNGSFGPTNFVVHMDIFVGTPTPVECGTGANQCYLAVLPGSPAAAFQTINFAPPGLATVHGTVTGSGGLVFLPPLSASVRVCPSGQVPPQCMARYEQADTI
jgi:neocarzinostatin family protein